MLTVRVGCNIHFECESSATVILLVNPRSDPERPIRQENLEFGIARKFESFTDTDGNVAYRIILGTGLNQIQHDAMVEVTTAFDKSEQFGNAPTIATIEPSLLRYLLPSRYCDSDKLFAFAGEKFGHIYDAGERVQAISDWVHNNIEYRFASGRPDISAAQIIERGYGVCRDFAHCTIALCRAINIPARYVTGHSTRHRTCGSGIADGFSRLQRSVSWRPMARL